MNIKSNDGKIIFRSKSFDLVDVIMKASYDRLVNADLSDKALYGLTVKDSNLSNANFESSILQDADFRG